MRAFLFALCATFLSGALTQANDSKFSFSAALAKKNQVGISIEKCNDIESKLGQLFYVAVYGYQEYIDSAGKKSVIHPTYIDLIRDIQPGGVLPHPWGIDPVQQRENFLELRALSKQPLLVGVDFFAAPTSQGVELNFGLGYLQGFTNAVKKASDRCIQDLAWTVAVLHREMGINQALGPTLDYTSKMYSPVVDLTGERATQIGRATLSSFKEAGVATTIKHYPFTPDSYDLHQKSEDTLIDEKEVRKRVQPFKDLKDNSDILMTTHLFNSKIDSNEMATFSKKWMTLLKSDLGYQGLVMTDALFMFDGYSETMKKMSSNWQVKTPRKIDFPESIYAAKAILAGHDMVLLESKAENSRRVFEDLLYLACQQGPVAREFYSRVLESYERITHYKVKQKKQLEEKPKLPLDLVRRLGDATKKLGLEAITSKERSCDGSSIIPGLRLEVARYYDGIEGQMVGSESPALKAE